MKTILIPTDFSLLSKHALKYAISLSQELNHISKIVLLNTYLLPPSPPQKLVEIHDELRKKSMNQLQDELNDAKKSHLPASISLEPLSYLGSLESVLGNLTQEGKIDCIILGIDPNSKKENLLKILTHTHCPVISVPLEKNPSLAS